MAIQKKTILITGACGWIGRNITKKLEKNNNITLKLTDSRKLNKKNFFKGDIQNKNFLNKITKNVDIVYHFAAISDIDESNADPFASLSINLNCSINLINFCIKNKVNKIIFGSSIYSLSSQGGIYSVTKRAVEDILQNLSKIKKIKFVILRFGSIYGFRKNDTGSIKKLIFSALSTKKLIRNTEGNEVRRYISIDDTIDLCIEILKKKYENKVINIVGKKKTAVRKIINHIAKKLKIKTIKYNKNKSLNYHYTINPNTYKIPMGKFIFKKNEKSITKEINKFIDEKKIYVN